MHPQLRDTPSIVAVFGRIAASTRAPFLDHTLFGRLPCNIGNIGAGITARTIAVDAALHAAKRPAIALVDAVRAAVAGALTGGVGGAGVANIAEFRHADVDLVVALASNSGALKAAGTVALTQLRAKLATWRVQTVAGIALVGVAARAAAGVGAAGGAISQRVAAAAAVWVHSAVCGIGLPLRR